MTGRSITLFIPFIPLTVCSVISSVETVSQHKSGLLRYRVDGLAPVSSAPTLGDGVSSAD